MISSNFSPFAKLLALKKRHPTVLYNLSAIVVCCYNYGLLVIALLESIKESDFNVGLGTKTIESLFKVNISMYAY